MLLCNLDALMSEKDRKSFNANSCEEQFDGLTWFVIYRPASARPSFQYHDIPDFLRPRALGFSWTPNCDENGHRQSHRGRVMHPNLWGPVGLRSASKASLTVEKSLLHSLTPGASVGASQCIAPGRVTFALRVNIRIGLIPPLSEMSVTFCV